MDELLLPAQRLFGAAKHLAHDKLENGALH